MFSPKSPTLLPLLALAGQVKFSNAATLFSGGTVIAWDNLANSIDIIRNGSVLVENDTITSVFSGPYNGTLPATTEVIDITDDIISTGFIDTHRHSWQTAFKTLGSNTTLVDYFYRFGSTSIAASILTPHDVYIGQLAGFYEALNAGVTTIVDFAHHTWSEEHALAGLNATIESGARAVYSYSFQENSFVNFTHEEQVITFEKIATGTLLSDTPVTLGIAYDGFNPGDPSTTRNIIDLAKKHNVSLFTTHSNLGVFGYYNSPQDVHSFDFLNQSIPLIFAHASYLSTPDMQLLRQFNQYISITPESEMHYGHDHPYSHHILDQASLGVDTHFTFSTDILTQARIWLQNVRRTLYREVIQRDRIPASNPMSAQQAFILATRNGGLALRRPDLGVLAPLAKADLLVWNGRSPSMLGWQDPVAAIMLHASIGDIKHVMVNGKFQKRNGQLTVLNYKSLQDRFLESARAIQQKWNRMSPPTLQGTYFTGALFERPIEEDVQRGNGTAY